MGYTTTFEGEFRLDRPLSAEQCAYLNAFSDTRRMRRDPAAPPPCPIRSAKPSGSPSGRRGPGSSVEPDSPGRTGRIDPRLQQTAEGPAGTLVPVGPGGDGATLRWNGAEKFYAYTEWLKYLIEHFLAPWGCRVRGTVRWSGEDPEDVGMIIVDDNAVRAHRL